MHTDRTCSVLCLISVHRCESVVDPLDADFRRGRQRCGPRFAACLSPVFSRWPTWWGRGGSIQGASRPTSIVHNLRRHTRFRLFSISCSAVSCAPELAARRGRRTGSGTRIGVCADIYRWEMLFRPAWLPIRGDRAPPVEGVGIGGACGYGGGERTCGSKRLAPFAPFPEIPHG